MKRIFRYLIIFFSILLIITACSQEKDAVLNTTPLPSWNKGSVKAAILDFITEATDKNNPNYIW